MSRRRFVEFFITLPRDASGEVLGAVATISDVTQRWEQEKNLRQKLVSLEAALQRVRATFPT